MKRPSKRSILFGAGFFATGFVAAVALTAGFATWLLQRNREAMQAGIVGDLAVSSALLKAADQSPDKLSATVIWQARQDSKVAAAMFGSLTKSYQSAVLRHFAELNRSGTLRADRSPEGNVARLARTMVLCTHASASPGVAHIGPDVTAFGGIPDWVLDPDAAPVAPVPAHDTEIPQLHERRVALLREWTTLHAWVRANQACFARQTAAS